MGSVKKSQQERRKNFFRYTEKNVADLQICGKKFIMNFFKFCLTHENVIEKYMDEVLHSILFLGHIHRKSYEPDAFLTQNEMEEIQRSFPDPFLKFKTHLPKQTPFSILLDAVVQIKGCENEEEILRFLAQMWKDMDMPEKPSKPNVTNYWDFYTLEATVVCVCYNDKPEINTPMKYYGASLSCRGKEEKQIFIALSCLHTWNTLVAHAVAFGEHGHAIQFPETVNCQAFERNWTTNQYQAKDACKKCQDIFLGISYSSQSQEDSQWPFGNCAETECLSKLLNEDHDLYHGTKLVKNGTTIDIQKNEIKNKAQNALIECLQKRNFMTNGHTLEFYNYKTHDNHVQS